MADDAQILREYIQTRSEAAFAELVQRHLALVYHAALRQLGPDRQLAEDVTQEVFILLAEKSRSLAGHPSLAGWLHTATHFKAMRALRAEQRRHFREGEAFAMTGPPEAAPEGDWAQLRPVIDQVLLELNERDREAVLLRFFENRPFAEIAPRLRLSEKSARKRVERALDKLRAQLARHGMTSTTAALATALANQSGLAAPAGLAATVTGAALASAAGGSATAFNVFHLMSTTKTIAIVATAAALLSISTAYNEYNQILGARAALAAGDREQNDLQNRLASAENTIQSLQARIGVLQEQATARAARSADPAEAKSTPRVVDGTGGKEPPAAVIIPAPQSLQSLTADQIQQNIQNAVRAHLPLFKALNLSLEQTDQFTNLLTRKQESAFAAANLALQQGADAATASQMVADAQAQVNAEIQAQFGDATYTQYQQYEQTFPQRNFVGDLQQILSQQNLPPLSDDQASQMIQLLAQTQVPDGGGSLLRQINGGINVRSQPSDQTVNQAAGLLSQGQLQMLQLMQQSMAAHAPIGMVNGTPTIMARPPASP